MGKSECCETFSSIFCEYKSIRFIRVRNVKLASIYWLTMFCVLCYVVIFTLVWEKGYQATDVVTGTSSAKLKGTGSIGNPDIIPSSQWIESGILPLDAMDLVQPSMEENAFFIITARSITPNQTREIDCEGNEDVPFCSFEDTSNCTQYETAYDPESQGLLTGNCSVNGRCQVFGWCPLENDTNPELIQGIGAFTAFVKIDINFEAFEVSRSNIYQRPVGNRAPVIGYNLFTIDYMLQQATNGEISNVSQVSERGAIILVKSIWNCNLDKDVNECNPQFQFARIDGEDGTISTGYNFRTVTYDITGQFRYLRKYYGLRFIFVTEGIAGKFDFAALTVTFGAGLAYLGIAAVIADIVLERFLPESKHYTEQKHKDLHGDPGQISLVAATSDDNAGNGYHSTA